MGVDIKQLAAGLGVSASTVSRALNGYTDIKAETRERIVKRANELNYHPNLRAQRLAKGRADAVGIVYPFDNGYVGNPKFLEMISAFSARLESSGIDLLLAAAGEASEMATYGVWCVVGVWMRFCWRIPRSMIQGLIFCKRRVFRFYATDDQGTEMILLGTILTMKRVVVWRLNVWLRWGISVLPIYIHHLNSITHRSGTRDLSRR